MFGYEDYDDFADFFNEDSCEDVSIPLAERENKCGGHFRKSSKEMDDDVIANERFEG